MDRRTMPVEDYKITPSEVGFAKKISQILKMEQVLRGALTVQQQKFESMAQVYGNLVNQKNMLLKLAPQKSTFDLPGMNFEEGSQGPEDSSMRPQEQPQEEQVDPGRWKINY